MSISVLYLDDRGKPAIDAHAVMQSAIELVFKTTDPADIDSRTIGESLAKAHSAILKVAARFLDRPQAALPKVPEAVIPAKFDAAPSPIPTRAVAPAPAVRTAPAEDAPEVVVRARAITSVPAVRKPIEEMFNIPPATAPAQAKYKRRRADVKPKTANKLPRRLTKIENALRMDTIICLEDGKAVVDLGKHLATLGMTPEQYLKKWKLPDIYPMKAPSFIQKRGVEYEYDPIRRRMIRT